MKLKANEIWECVMCSGNSLDIYLLGRWWHDYRWGQLFGVFMCRCVRGLYKHGHFFAVFFTWRNKAGILPKVPFDCQSRWQIQQQRMKTQRALGSGCHLCDVCNMHGHSQEKSVHAGWWAADFKYSSLSHANIALYACHQHWEWCESCLPFFLED